MKLPRNNSNIEQSRELRPVISAGGVVLRNNAGANVTELLVVKRSKDIEPKWRPVLCQLPKGGVEQGETLEQAALREVLEETGYETRIHRKAGTASWSYERAGTRYQETVHYFLMSPISGTPRPHDGEFDDVCWTAIAAGQNVLSYPEERQLLIGLLPCDETPC